MTFPSFTVLERMTVKESDIFVCRLVGQKTKRSFLARLNQRGTPLSTRIHQIDELMSKGWDHLHNEDKRTQASRSTVTMKEVNHWLPKKVFNYNLTNNKSISPLFPALREQWSSVSPRGSVVLQKSQTKAKVITILRKDGLAHKCLTVELSKLCEL